MSKQKAKPKMGCSLTRCFNSNSSKENSNQTQKSQELQPAQAQTSKFTNKVLQMITKLCQGQDYKDLLIQIGNSLAEYYEEFKSKGGNLIESSFIKLLYQTLDLLFIDQVLNFNTSRDFSILIETFLKRVVKQEQKGLNWNLQFCEWASNVPLPNQSLLNDIILKYFLKNDNFKSSACEILAQFIIKNQEIPVIAAQFLKTQQAETKQLVLKNFVQFLSFPGDKSAAVLKIQEMFNQQEASTQCVSLLKSLLETFSHEEVTAVLTQSFEQLKNTSLLESSNLAVFEKLLDSFKSQGVELASVVEELCKWKESIEIENI